MKGYDHKEIEKKWQAEWAKNRIYTTPDAVPGKDNFYLLVEFPYPSGNLHVGHWYAFAIPDILARAMRMQGKNVMYPIGFDAFGLPAENAAIKNNLNPRDWTEQNIAYMTNQIQSMGTSFDWSREVRTIDPAYYKWTQWQFLQLYKKGLVYQKETAVNWCPFDKTVLANEQVIDGRCERCGNEVVQKQMLQWNIKITDYADRLIDDLEPLDWPKEIKESQRNWIGRSEGVEIDFPLDFGKKYKYVILHGLHGFNSNGNKKRLAWMKEELEKLGHEVLTPSLPNPNEPSEEEWVDAALSATTYDENTVLCGFSLGGVTALKVLEKLRNPIARVVLAGGFVDTKFKDGKSREYEKRWNWEFETRTVKNNAKSITILHDPEDHTISDDQAKRLSELLGAPITLGKSNKSHFTGDKEPDVLMWLRPTVRVFTTRPDTLFGATYLVLAPEHPWVTLALQHSRDTHDGLTKSVIRNAEEVEAYVAQANKKTELERQTDTKEKTGVRLEGVEAINPATGEKIPLFVADYVLGHYGTGAIMAVPAHDGRDYDFARKFDLPIKQVVMPVFGAEDKRPDAVYRQTVSAYVRHKDGKILVLRWPEYKWVTGVIGGIEHGETPEQAAEREVLEETGYKAKAISVSPIAIESHFYAEHKKEWRSRLDTPVLLDLIDEHPIDIDPEESKKHTGEWMTAEQALNSEMFRNNKFALELALGRVTAYAAPRYGEDQVVVGSGDPNSLSVADAKRKATELYGREKKTYRLRDWIVSRQRYWGVPIPIIHCEKCGIQPVPDEQLPVELPAVEDYLPSGEGKSPLVKVKSFVETTCPKCGGKAERETDTLDTFVDSSWHFLRYTDPQNPHAFAAREKQDHWMPVSLYSGGAEHTTMHLLYSRFWHKALFDMGLVADSEPYARRMNRSIILGPDGQKMSKSRGNVIDPDEVVERLGADTVRLYLAFIGPYNEVASYPWNPDGVVGARRFLERVWKLQEKLRAGNEAIEKFLHKLIKKVSDDVPLLKFNTAIAAMMAFLNEAEKQGISKAQYLALIQLLAPFAPHMAEELWHELGGDGTVHTQPWPQYDPAKIVDDTVTLGIQINGKTRGEVSVAADADKATVEAAAKEVVADRLAAKEILRTIIVPKRLVNFVIKD